MGQLIVGSTIDAELTHNDLSTTKTFHDLVVGVGTDIEDDGHSYSNVMLWASTVAAKWRMIRRVGYVFNTSAIPDDKIIDSATLQVYGWSKNDGLPCTPNVCLYAFTPASEAVLVIADYAEFGTVELSNLVTYAAWPSGGSPAWVTFTLNAAGLALINKTGNTCIGTRNASFDVADELDPNNHDPTWRSNNDSFLLSYGRNGETLPSEGPIFTVNYSDAPVPPSGSGDGSYFARKVAWQGF